MSEMAPESGMYFESINKNVVCHQLSAPEFDYLEANLYLFLNEAASPEQADAARRDLEQLRVALGRIARKEYDR
jgi:hypothetical protein